MAEHLLSAHIGRRVSLTGHFDVPVVLEDVRPLGARGSAGYECRIRLPDGALEEAVISPDEADAILGAESTSEKAGRRPADGGRLRLLVESTRIRLAYAYDRQFAVSLSGIRTLPHQIEAVYLKMLPQPRLRFLLADDPGAGKTIMAGLLIKELKLRDAIDRCLILVPAPLTIQWQDELLRFFNEPFQIIHSANDQQQLLNLWERERQVISSIDYAKQDDVRQRVWQQSWDLVIIDEAHKCSAYTKRSAGRGDEVERTKRYQLAERLSDQCDNLLLMTATPHHGDDDRFAHFIRLLDRDLFPEPHRFGDEAGRIRRDVLKLGTDCPWSLRRLKEDLKDMHGQRLFPDRHVNTVSFALGPDEYTIYKAVTAYINEFLPQATGRRKNSVALARTVFQRRLASSTHAIHQSLRRRHQKLDDLLRELDGLPPAQRARRLAQLQGRLSDTEQDEDDLDESARDALIDEATSAAELDQLRTELAELADLVARAGRVREVGRDSKLVALRECLQRSEFDELQDGRGKLLLFTEHRDTLEYLREHLEAWGYSTCQIHGGMNPRERKETQESFRTNRQICVATEAAGEGINLQFCHLMINYDLPWNPTRLEQRLGRIHRIGQTRDVYAFNFVATSSEDGQPVIEGRILERLLSKLDLMREALGDRVFDVVGEVLSLNKVNLPDMLREVAYEPRRLDDYLDAIDRIDPELLDRYEEATGIALARGHVDFSAFAQANLEAEERRLMPRYVESHFVTAAKAVGLRSDARADGLWRIEHVRADLRSEHLAAVRRLGPPDPSYRKLTFYKEHLEQDQHLDAVLLGPGHPVYAAVDEKLNELLKDVESQMGVYMDPLASAPYRAHFCEITIRGQTTNGEATTILAELVAVREEVAEGVPAAERFGLVPADILIDLPEHPNPPDSLPTIDYGPVVDYVKTTVQMDRRSTVSGERGRYADVARDYLQRSFDARVRTTENTAIESALLKLYDEVWLPVSGDGELTLESVGIGGRPLQTTLDERKHALIHQRLVELLTTVQRRVFGSLAPGKIAELFNLGDPGNHAAGIATTEVLKGFYEFLGFPRLLSAEAVRKAIARGVETGLFGYATGRPQLGEDGRFLIDRTRVAFERSVADDEVDLDAGLLIAPSAIPEKPSASSSETTGGDEEGGDTAQPGDGDGSGEHPSFGEGSGVVYPTGGREIAVSFVADQKNVYDAWNALANLADVAGTISIHATAKAPEGYDEAKLENGVFEPLRELGLIDDD